MSLPVSEHAHGHLAHHHSASGGSNHLALALALTLSYSLVELASGLWFDSLALVSDAGHMFSDAFALGLAWFAAWLMRRPAGSRHSFGWARAEVIAGFVNSLAMLLVVVLIAVEAIDRLLHPTAAQGLGVMVVAFVGLLVNLLVAALISRGERTLNTRAALLHVISDMVGSVAALVAGAVIHFTGWQPIDPILSLVIGLLILGSTLRLLREALHVLMEGVPTTIELEDVGRTLARIDGVRNVHDLHIWNISSGQMALSAHLQLADLQHWPLVLEHARRLLQQRFDIGHVTLQPETPSMAEAAIVKVSVKR